MPRLLDTVAPSLSTATEPRHPGGAALPPGERLAAALLFLAALALRVAYIFRYRYDSDEPQHLHTTWGWTQGLLQYRDFFDNHTPLFHILMSPLLRLAGEGPDVLDRMRLFIVPLWLVSLGSVAAIGSRLFSRRAGIWAAIGVALFPGFFFCSVEYRTDNLWTPLWLVTIAFVVHGGMRPWRAFVAGLLLGVCFMVSMKTTLMLAVVALSTVLALVLAEGRRAPWRRLALCAGAALAGLPLAPAAVAGYFTAQGAWKSFLYGTIQHNLLAGVDAHNQSSHSWMLFPLLAPVVMLIAFWVARQTPELPLRRRRTFLVLAAGLYIVMLDSFWTLLTRQDYLPYFPLAAAVLAPLVLFLIGKVKRIPSAVLLGALGGIEIAFCLLGRPLRIDGTAPERELLSQVLRLTRPGEMVLDFKGEAVFRQRAYYYVLEPLTYVRLRRGLIVDDIAEMMVRDRICVALTWDRWFPTNARDFLAANFLPIGIWRVPGCWLDEKKEAVGEGAGFTLPIATTYAAVTEAGPAQGVLDGTPYTGPRELAAGKHTFLVQGAPTRIAVIWSRAIETGFSPFHIGNTLPILPPPARKGKGNAAAD